MNSQSMNINTTATTTTEINTHITTSKIVLAIGKKAKGERLEILKGLAEVNELIKNEENNGGDVE